MAIGLLVLGFVLKGVSLILGYLVLGWIVILPWFVQKAAELRAIATMFDSRIAMGIVFMTLLCWPLHLFGMIVRGHHAD